MLGNGMPGLTEAGRLRSRKSFGRRLEEFRREEDGTLLIYGLFIFVSMLFMTGIALDLMRFEERRTVLHATVDRAALAAADMDQTLECKAVVRDWFIKANETPPADNKISCTKNDFGTEVTIDTSAMMDTWFMNMFGIETLVTPAVSTAEEKVGSVEISLVLDVSGSMNSSNRLTNLKPAAKSFIDQMFDNVEPGKISMSVVTYSTQVALGPDLMKYFYTAPRTTHTYSSCLEFNSSDFSTTAMSPKSTPVGSAPAGSDRAYVQNGNFDPFYTSLVNVNSSSTLLNCPQSSATNRDTLAFSGSRTALKAKIDSLVASGNTSIDLGMKWGAALLDPSMRPVASALIAEGKVPTTFSGRPYSYTNANGTANTDVLKVLVIMTDGENTTEYKLKDVGAAGYTTGLSTLYYNNTASSSYTGSNFYKRFSLFDSARSGNKYYSFYHSAWRSAPWGSVAADISGTDTTVQLTWPEVWNMMSVNWFADNIIYGAYNNSSTRNSWRTSASNAVATSSVYSNKDSLTLGVCSAAKANGVKVFTIGFDAPTAGQNLLKSCASSPAHYYLTSGSNITKVFASIANSINKLRLTH